MEGNQNQLRQYGLSSLFLQCLYIQRSVLQLKHEPVKGERSDMKIRVYMVAKDDLPASLRAVSGHITISRGTLYLVCPGSHLG
ncbi:hypothetical protein SLE2022_353290 [Rubroshorea leprosula]